MLHRLEFGDRLAELPPLFRVCDRVIERALREADHLRADADPALVERLDRDLVALADLAEHVGARHAAFLEQQLAGAPGADAELVFLLADREAGKPRSTRNAVMPRYGPPRLMLAKTMKTSASFALVIQSFGRSSPSRRPRRAGGHRERVAARSGSDSA